jgi:hypothetical protein
VFERGWVFGCLCGRAYVWEGVWVCGRVCGLVWVCGFVCVYVGVCGRVCGVWVFA